MKPILIFVLAFLCLSAGAQAGEADVEQVRVRREGPGLYRFDVTLRHGDIGWKHYADRWDVVGPDGTVLGARTLFHPHETEQPFTRSLTGVRIPASVSRVTIRAHDKVHGLSGRTMTVEIK